MPRGEKDNISVRLLAPGYQELVSAASGGAIDMARLVVVVGVGVGKCDSDIMLDSKVMMAGDLTLMYLGNSLLNQLCASRPPEVPPSRISANACNRNASTPMTTIAIKTLKVFLTASLGPGRTST